MIRNILLRPISTACLSPGILNQLGAESLSHLKKLASNVTGGGGEEGGSGEAGDKPAKAGEAAEDDDDDDDVPDLVGNFDDASKGEGVIQGESAKPVPSTLHSSALVAGEANFWSPARNFWTLFCYRRRGRFNEIVTTRVCFAW